MKFDWSQPGLQGAPAVATVAAAVVGEKQTTAVIAMACQQ